MFVLIIVTILVLGSALFYPVMAADRCTSMASEAHAIVRGTISSNSFSALASPLGTLNDHVTFTKGSRAGQKELTVITFHNDGTLTEITSGASGSGKWSVVGRTPEGKTLFYYFFDVPLGAGQIHVCQNALLSPDGKYTSEGEGIFLLFGWPLPMSRSSTTTWAYPLKP